MTHDYDVAIVGAGLAGLSAARQLSIHGVTCRVIDSADSVGGRVRSDHIDGFTLDRGFQLYNPAYPEAARVLDHEALRLHALVRGMNIVREDRNRRRVIHLADPRTVRNWHPSVLSKTAGTILGKARFAAYARTAATLRGRQFDSRPDEPAQVALARAGIDATLIDEVLAPFLTGVFLEPHLMTSRRFMDAVLASFVKGSPSLPAAGMQAIPDQLHHALPEQTVQLSTTAQSVGSEYVDTEDGRIHARVVIVATDAPSAVQLIPDAHVKAAGNSVTTWYHAVPTAQLPQPLAAGRAALTVDPHHRGPLINTVPLSYAVPDYAPSGWVLVSSSALGTDSNAESQVRTHLSWLYGTDTSSWQFVAHYPIAYALPSMRPPLRIDPPRSFEPVIMAGDHTATASIQGAMVSGRRAANEALDRLGVRRADDRRLVS